MFQFVYLTLVGSSTSGFLNSLIKIPILIDFNFIYGSTSHFQDGGYTTKSRDFMKNCHCPDRCLHFHLNQVSDFRSNLIKNRSFFFNFRKGNDPKADSYESF